MESCFSISLVQICNRILSNYDEYFDQKYNWAAESAASVLDVRPVPGPHSNPWWVLAELGMIGFVLYLACLELALWMWHIFVASCQDSGNQKTEVCCRCGVLSSGLNLQ